MSQTFGIPMAGTGTVAAGRATINDAFMAVATMFSGATEPGSPFAGQWWHDLTAGSIKIRNQANSAWITIIDDSTVANGGALLLSGGTMTGAIDMDSQGIDNLAAGVAAGDAVNKGQVDARPHVISLQLGNFASTKTIYILTGGPAMTIVSGSIVVGATIALSGSAYWDVAIQNITQTEDLAAAAYTTADAGITVGVATDLGLDQNLSIAANDVLAVTLTKTGAVADLETLCLTLRYTVAT